MTKCLPARWPALRAESPADEHRTCGKDREQHDEEPDPQRGIVQDPGRTISD